MRRIAFIDPAHLRHNPRLLAMAAAELIALGIAAARATAEPTDAPLEGVISAETREAQKTPPTTRESGE